MTKSFDLNLEEVLQDWEIEHGVREVISNALDEQLLTNLKNIEITKELKGRWHIRDFGRGLQIEHFTLNENPEKLNSSLGLICKFEVGLNTGLLKFLNLPFGLKSGCGIIIMCALMFHWEYAYRLLPKCDILKCTLRR